MKATENKLTPVQWFAGVAEDMRNKLFLKIITPMEYYEKLTEALKTAMEQEKKQIKKAFLKNDNSISITDALENFEQYYNDTFKQD